MRVAVIFVAVVVVATPAHASNSCMSKTEARRHYGSAHLYWHGPNHCWDATSGRRRNIARIQRKHTPPVRQQDRTEWRESRSEMLASSGLAQVLEAETSGGDGRSENADPAPLDTNWLDRWVAVVQVAPIPLIKAASEPAVASTIMTHESRPTDTPHDIVLVLFGMGMAMAFVGVVFSLRER